MRMKNPVHPGELVRADHEALGLSVAEAAKRLGVTRQQLYNVVNGRSAVPAEMAVRFPKEFGRLGGNVAPYAGRIRLGAGAPARRNDNRAFLTVRAARLSG